MENPSLPSAELSSGDGTPRAPGSSSSVSPGLRLGPTSDPPRELSDFLCRMRAEALFTRVFPIPSVAIAILRFLDDVERMFVLRLLHFTTPLRYEPFVIWTQGDHRATLDLLNSLISRRILCVTQVKESVNLAGGDDAARGTSLQETRATTRYGVQRDFQKALGEAFAAGFSVADAMMGTPIPGMRTPLSREALNSHSVQQWNALLRWMVNDVVAVECATANPASALNPGGLRREMHMLRISTDAEPLYSPCSHLVEIFARKKLRTQEVPTDGNLMRGEAFTWLLLDWRSQLVSLCVEFLLCIQQNVFFTESTQASGISPALEAELQMADALALILTLSAVRIGRPCQTTNLTQCQRLFLNIAYDLGVVWMKDPLTSRVFHPTPTAKLLQSDGPEVQQLLTVLASGSKLGSGSKNRLPDEWYDDACFGSLDSVSVCDQDDVMTELEALGDFSSSTVESGIVVESNFKVFAYTASALQISVVSHLCELKVLTPCLVVGLITRESILRAYKSGIRAAHIERFLTTHAHPSVHAKFIELGKPIIPSNISSQLHMWEEERRRMKLTKACVFEFSKESDLDTFPAAASRGELAGILCQTTGPPSAHPQNPEFLKWKASMLERIRSKKPPTAMNYGENDGDLAPAPVLAVSFEFKDDMTKFVRSYGQKQAQRERSSSPL